MGQLPEQYPWLDENNVSDIKFQYYELGEVIRRTRGRISDKIRQRNGPVLAYGRRQHYAEQLSAGAAAFPGWAILRRQPPGGAK